MAKIIGVVQMDISSSDKHIMVHSDPKVIEKVLRRYKKGQYHYGCVLLGLEYDDEPGVYKYPISKDVSRR
jgi:hypothetical protein